MTDTLLVVDDEESICWGIEKIGHELGFQVRVASTAEQAIQMASEHPIDVIVTDVCLPGMTGLDAIAVYRKTLPQIPIVVMTAHGDLKTAVDAVRHGAFEYLIKPFSVDTVRQVLRRCLAEVHHPSSLEVIREVAEAVEGFVAESTIMQLVFNRMALAAASEASVLITGESGTGKELAARAIHTFSLRAKGPFVPVNLAALAPTLAESELFGHVKGAFTGADAARTGLLAQADGGTLFLDEVADIPLAIQVKLLRALETQEVVPVGGNQPIRTRFRVIAATHRNLNQLMADSRFRHDLYFRLGAFQIDLPPLRERREDIEPLSRHFLSLLGAASAASHAISPDVIRELQRRNWWGNVRELRNAIQHAMIVARGGTIQPEHLPPALPRFEGNVTPRPIQDTISEQLAAWAEAQFAGGAEISNLYERLMQMVEPPVFRKVLELNQGQFVSAAKVLGLHRTTLKKKMDEYDSESG